MRRTILLLVGTLIAVPLISFRFDVALTSLQSDTLAFLIKAYLATALLCFVVGQATGNVSQVDKLWSILPMGYAWWMAWTGGLTPRLLLMALLITAWGARLTFNFARRGGYSWRFWTGEEDYRWAVLRRDPLLSNPWAWTLFNLGFICLYQLGLILLFCLPMLLVIGEGDGAITPADGLLAVVLVALLVVETVADQQQWEFQQAKLRGAPGEGFLQRGLWAWVRHPNYAAEQGIWLVVYAFSVVATGRWVNWSFCGALLLMLLFQGSSDFSERISASKYPGYEAYRRRVPRFLPWPRRNGR